MKRWMQLSAERRQAFAHGLLQSLYVFACVMLVMEYCFCRNVRAMLMSVVELRQTNWGQNDSDVPNGHGDARNMGPQIQCTRVIVCRFHYIYIFDKTISFLFRLVAVTLQKEVIHSCVNVSEGHFCSTVWPCVLQWAVLFRRERPVRGFRRRITLDWSGGLLQPQVNIHNAPFYVDFIFLSLLSTCL